MNNKKVKYIKVENIMTSSQLLIQINHKQISTIQIYIFGNEIPAPKLNVVQLSHSYLKLYYIYSKFHLINIHLINQNICFNKIKFYKLK